MSPSSPAPRHRRVPSRSAGRLARYFTVIACGGTGLLLAPLAHAAPGVANRLAGANAQGPASSSVTAIYHNPAMLGRMPGVNFEASLRAGIDHLAVRREAINTNGSPTGTLGATQHLVNPAFDYFVGISFMLDPVAIGAAVHTFDSRMRVDSGPDLSYHLAPDTDFGCGLDSSRSCPRPRTGGMLEMRTDIDLSLAWNALDFMSIGATVHLPRQRSYLGRDVDSVLTAASGSGCDPQDPNSEVESEACAERLSFRGSTRLRWFGLSDRPSTRLDLALTVGVVFDIRDRVVIGLRYRTQPLLGQGKLTLNGKAVVCLPYEANSSSDLPTCENAEAIDATLTERLPQELALGVSGGVGNWSLDSNLYWIDRCPLGGVAGCDGRDGSTLELVGLDQDASTLSETTIYRGLRDVFGAELWARYRLDDTLGANLPYYKVLCSGGSEGVDPETGKQLRCVPRMDLLLGAGFNSPGVRQGALTVANSDAWTMLATLGTSFNFPGRNGTWSLIPAYALDFRIPTRVGGGRFDPAFDPAAAIDFEQSGADLNSDAADAVLAGRGLPTNAGLYTGAIHTLLFNVRWSERGFGARELPTNRR